MIENKKNKAVNLLDEIESTFFRKMIEDDYYILTMSFSQQKNPHEKVRELDGICYFKEEKKENELDSFIEKCKQNMKILKEVTGDEFF